MKFKALFNVRCSACNYRPLFLLLIVIILFKCTFIEIPLVANNNKQQVKHNKYEILKLTQKPFFKNYQHKLNYYFKMSTSFETLLNKSRHHHINSSTTKPDAVISNQKLSKLLSKIIVQLNSTQIVQLAEDESNLPISYWKLWQNFKQYEYIFMRQNVTYCDNVQLSAPDQLKHNNLYWQRFNDHSNSAIVPNIYLYNAYYDNRVEGKAVVRLIGMNNQLVNGRPKWWCLLWFDYLKQPALVRVSEYENLWPWKQYLTKGDYHPQLVTCPIPLEYGTEVPRAVSLQSHGNCSEIVHKPSNVLRVIYRPAKQTRNLRRRSIGVCVQAFRFATYDVSVRLVEWLEAIRLMGADKVYLYEYGNSGNVRKVLQYYQSEGLVQWRRITLPGRQVNINSYYNLLAHQMGQHFWPTELLELNDCLYRNLYQHDYIAVIDIDEVIVPQRLPNWIELIKSIENSLSINELKNISYYSNIHAHVCENIEESHTSENASIPEYLYMMRHIQRSEPCGSGQIGKCFIRTDMVKTVHNHSPLLCLSPTGHTRNCNGLTLQSNSSLLMHYRRNQSNPKLAYRNSNCLVRDVAMRRHYQWMETNVRKQLTQIFVD